MIKGEKKCGDMGNECWSLPRANDARTAGTAFARWHESRECGDENWSREERRRRRMRQRVENERPMERAGARECDGELVDALRALNIHTDLSPVDCHLWYSFCFVASGIPNAPIHNQPSPKPPQQRDRAFVHLFRILFCTRTREKGVGAWAGL